MDIAGYYYDPKKNRYFKIEDSKTAPAQSDWSSDKVKKRKIQDKEAVEALRRMKLNKGRIKRAKVLSHPLTGGFLAREFGTVSEDVPLVSFANGLVEKGSLPLEDLHWRNGTIIKKMCIVSTDSRTDVGVGYATIAGHDLVSTYIPRDVNGRLHPRLLSRFSVPGAGPSPYREIPLGPLSDISDIKSHLYSKRILVAARDVGANCSLWSFNPVYETEEARPLWRLGSGNRYRFIPNGRCVYTSGTPPTSVLDDPDADAFHNFRSVDLRQYPISDPEVDLEPHQPGYESDHERHGTGMQASESLKDCQPNVIAPAPANSSHICAVGTNRGILTWNRNSRLEWLHPSVRQPSTEENQYQDIFEIDYQEKNANVMLAGGRPGYLFLADSRTNHRYWSRMKHSTSIVHVKSINENHALVSGPKNIMCVYDIRAMKEREKDVSPVVTFPEYQNKAHINIGLDVEKVCGIVAAAHDDGGVALYSVKSGMRLTSLDIDKIKFDRGPIQALQFVTMARDTTPTLFVGVGKKLHAYSSGVRKRDDEA